MNSLDKVKAAVTGSESGMSESDKAIDEERLRESLDAEVKRLAHLFRFIMKYKEHFQPSGVEFSGLRQYLPSDDASRIDWKISSGKPDLYVKQFDEEVNMDVFIILDVSDSMLFGTAEKLKSEYAAVVAAALTYSSIEASIDVGFTMRGDGERTLLTPRGGQVQYQAILDELTDVENYGGTFNLEAALDDTIGQIKDNTAVFIISDFIDTEGEWKTKMKLSSMKFRHVMTVMTRDLRDYEMPESGNVRFESPDGVDSMVVHSDRLKKSFDRAAQEQEETISDKVEGAGSGFLKIDTRDKFSAAFAEYFDSNKEQW